MARGKANGDLYTLRRNVYCTLKGGGGASEVARHGYGVAQFR